MSNADIADNLVAYLDGELNETQIEELEALLETSTELRGALSMLCRQRLMLAQLHQEKAKRKTPPVQDKVIKHSFSTKTTRKRSRQRSSKNKNLTLILSIAAALLFAVAWQLIQPTTTTHIEGQVIADLRNDLPILGHSFGDITWSKPHSVGQQLSENETIILGDNADLSLNYPDGSILVFKQAAKVDILKDKRVFLHNGNVVASIKKQTNNSSVGIQTKASDIRVIGTQFTVQVSDDRTITAVSEGIVSVTDKLSSKEYRVQADEECSIHNTDKDKTALYITGIVKEIVDGDGWHLTLQTKQGEKIYAPQWIGGQARQGGGPNKAVIEKLRRLHAGNKVKVLWLEDPERTRVMDVVLID